MLKRLGVAVAVLLVFVACGDGGKAAADAAMAALQSSYDAVKADAATYFPDQTRRLEEAFASARDTLAKGEYGKTIDEVRGLAGMVGDLRVAVAARRAELVKAWDELTARVPAAVESLQKQADALARTKKLPDGVTKDAVDAARAAVPALAASWAEAVAAFKSANLTDATAKAQALKGKSAEIMASLGMTVPDALK